MAATGPRGLHEVLPNLLLNKTALQFKQPELRAYVATLDARRFHDVTYLHEIRTHMERHKLMFWKRLDVTITVQPPQRAGTPQRVLEWYHSVPQMAGRTCEVVGEGSNVKPWVVRSGSSVGEHPVKKVARMIAIIRACIDPEFDPNGDSPLPSKRRRVDRSSFTTAS